MGLLQWAMRGKRTMGRWRGVCNPGGAAICAPCMHDRTARADSSRRARAPAAHARLVGPTQAGWPKLVTRRVSTLYHNLTLVWLIWGAAVHFEGALYQMYGGS